MRPLAVPHFNYRLTTRRARGLPGPAPTLAPPETPPGVLTHTAGPRRCHPGRRTPEFTAGSGDAGPTSKGRQHPGRRTPATVTMVRSHDSSSRAQSL